jgi:arginine N-succinyltransferase
MPSKVKNHPVKASVNVGGIVVREVRMRDLDPLYALAQHLDSVNLPHDRKVLRRLIARSIESFSGTINDPDRRQYFFVAEDVLSKNLVGTSMIIARHGHLDEPHIFFEVGTEERYSGTVKRYFRHPTLCIGFNFHGPTEVGALVIHPEHRGIGVGKVLSFSRFLFIAMHRDLFQDHVLAELMPPLLEDGRSLLWEHLGRHFTGLSYQEADKLSLTNKEFIFSLFPQTRLYVSLLPRRIQKLIGQVGPETRNVQRMLESIGFAYSHQIDPFDGGPHFQAPTDRISIVQHATHARIFRQDRKTGSSHPQSKDGPSGRFLLASERQGRFRSVVADIDRTDDEKVILSSATRKQLGVREDDTVWMSPLKGARDTG